MMFHNSLTSANLFKMLFLIWNILVSDSLQNKELSLILMFQRYSTTYSFKSHSTKRIEDVSPFMKWKALKSSYYSAKCKHSSGGVSVRKRFASLGVILNWRRRQLEWLLTHCGPRRLRQKRKLNIEIIFLLKDTKADLIFRPSVPAFGPLSLYRLWPWLRESLISILSTASGCTVSCWYWQHMVLLLKLLCLTSQEVSYF